MQDERILNTRERALLATLLQHAKAKAAGNRETQDAVQAVVASAVGETVAQRAFAVLGGSIVERILEGGQSTVDSDVTRTADFRIDATNPSPEPDPGVRKPVKEPQPPGKAPLRSPDVPAPSPGEPDPGVRKPVPVPRRPMGEPDPLGHAVHTVVSETRLAVVERPAVLPAKCVVLDEFLSPQEVGDLTRFTLEHETDFAASEVLSPTSESGVIDYEHRRSRVLMDLTYHQDVILQRIKAVLPQILQKLGMEEFSIADVEAQITASNDGDFFRFHSDNTSEQVASRYLTFVYFFHREPRRFEGGELRIHDAHLDGGRYVSEGSYQTIIPQQNQIVFFQCEMLHEITPVKCPSQLFADSRFTLNGWLRR